MVTATIKPGESNSKPGGGADGALAGRASVGKAGAVTGKNPAGQ